MPGFGDGPRFFNFTTDLIYKLYDHGYQQTCCRNHDP